MASRKALLELAVRLAIAAGIGYVSIARAPESLDGLARDAWNIAAIALAAMVLTVPAGSRPS